MKKEKKVWAFTLLAFWFLAPNQIIAQVDSVKRLDEVVITATRSEQPVLEIPRSVSVINTATIEKLPYNSVGELLIREPGIFIVGANQTPGTNQSIFMRGSNSNQCVVLIDGTRITDPSSPGSSIDLSELSLTDVERIEIIRGSHSTMYGGAAIGGAINIITKKSKAPGFHGIAGVQGGTMGNGSVSGAQNLSLTYSFKNGFYANGSLFNQNVRGLNATQDTIRTAGVYKTADEDNFRKTDAYLKAGFLKGAWDVSASFKNIDQKADIDDGAYNDDDNAILNFDRVLWNYNARYRIDPRWEISVLGSWSNSRRSSLNDSSRISNNDEYDATYSSSKYYGKLFTNEAVLNYKGEELKGVFGAGQYREDMHFNTYYFSNAFGFPFESETNYDSIKTSARTNYLFAQLTYEKGRFAVTAGSRLSDHSLFGRNLTYEIDASYLVQNLLVYGSLSSGYNSPSLYQLYDPSTGFGYFTTRGNADLQPEESVSIEVGVKREYDNGSYATISGFTTQTTNAIEYVNLWKNTRPVSELDYSDYQGDTYLNVSNQVIRGVELSGQAVVNKFYLKGNLTWIDGKVTFGPDDLDRMVASSNYVQLFNYGAFVTSDQETGKLARKPRFMGMAELGFRPKKELLFTAAVRHTSSRLDLGYDASLGPFGALGTMDVKKYNLVDIGAMLDLTTQFAIHGKVENLLGEDFQEILGFQTRGRSAYLKLIFKW